MELQDVSSLINRISSDLVFFDENTGKDDWVEVGRLFGEVKVFADNKKVTVLSDAGKLAEELAKAFEEKQIPNFNSGMECLSAILTIMSSVTETLSDERAVVPSFKNEFSEIRLFLDDLKVEGDASIEQEGQSSEDEEFLRLMLDRITNVESILLGLNSGELSRQPVKDIFREFHTLKGETGILGMDRLHEFFHSAESALEPLRNDPAVITDDFISSLMAVNDISRMLLKGEDDSKKTTEKAIKKALGSLSKAVKAAWEKAQQSGGENEEDIDDDDDDFFADAQEDSSSGPENKTDAADIKLSVDGEPDYSEHFAEKISEQLPEFEMADDSDKGENGAIEEEPVPEGEKINYIPLDVKKIDKLLDLVANTTAAANQIIQNDAIKSIPHSEVGEDLITLDRAVSGLQNLTVGLRMMPARSLFQAMRRVAYDVGRSSHKRVMVKMEGLNTEVDRTVLENITGAFTHLVRNSIDHGLEDPAERRKKSKPEKGLIVFRAYRNSGNIVFEIEDDGKGLDSEKIRNKAIEKGFLKSSDKVDDDTLYSLIFKTGLSTAEKITGVSGRGVGMEAVKSSIDGLRGRINISSKKDIGTTVKITLPLSLSSIEGLVVTSGKNYYIIPAHSVRECFKADKESLSYVEGKGTLVSIRGGLLPVVNLGRELAIDYNYDDPCDGVLVIIENQMRMAALLVDEVMRTRQIMVRPLDGPLANVRHVSGTADLGGRKVGFVLEFNEILEKSSVDNRSFGAGFKSGDKIETVDIGSNQVGMVDFYLDYLEGAGKKRSRFAINAFKAKEFVTKEELTSVPGAPQGFQGMLLLRDKTIPVVGLSELLGFNADPDSEQIIIVCEFGSHTIGITVNGVNRVNYISWGDILPPPESGNNLNTNYIVGTILMGEDVVFVLDFEHIVQEVLKIYLDVGKSFDGVERRKTGSKVFLVEDSELVRRKISSALKEVGLQVEEAPNGQVALDRILEIAKDIEDGKGNVFDYLDIVVSDIEMPQLDGYTLTINIKKNPHLVGLPVILHSSLTNDTIVKRAKEVHADGVVGKKDPAELASYLKQYL